MTTSIDLTNKHKLQSPYLYLDAAGSLGTLHDDVPEGIPHKITKGMHLRWALMGELGRNHIPKGALGEYGAYIGDNGLNQSGNDYVKVYRTAFNSAPITVDLSALPDSVSQDHDEPFWIYDVATPIECKVFVRFLISKSDYNSQGGNVQGTRLNFIQNFNGEIEIGINNDLFFGISLELRTDTATSPSIELKHFSNLGNELIISQKLSETTQQTNVSPPYTIHETTTTFQENIRYTRVSWNSEAELSKVTIHHYEAFIKANSWEQLDDHSGTNPKKGFSLSNDWDNLVSKRLLGDSGNYELEYWPRFTKAYLTDKTAYEKRFCEDPTSFDFDDYNGVNGAPKEDYMVYAIHKYLLATKDGYEEAGHETDSQDQDASMGFRYTDLLNTASIDFHIARMLGLGHIDKFTEATGPLLSNVGDSDLFVYLVEYTTPFGNDQNDGHPITHYYMCPPISLQDEKEPGPFEMDIEKGVKSSHTDSFLITDDDGYSKYEQARYIGLLRNVTNDIERINIDSSYEPSSDYSRWHNSISVLYHLESNVTSSFEVIEELYEDSEVTPTISNTLPYMEVENAFLRLHIHKITENTPPHSFQGCGVNWFMRPMGMSNNNPSLDETLFDDAYGLMPPSNFHAHYIQPESPRIFTTQDEQALHIGKVRLTFEWNAIHHHTAHKATSTPQVKFAFRKALPNIVKGAIASIAVASDESMLVVTTEGYSNKSVNPIETIVPNIGASDASKFAGGIMSIDGRQYVVDSINQTGINPKIKIRRIEDRIAHQPGTNEEYQILSAYRDPKEGLRFTLIENLNSLSEWDEELTQVLDINVFDPTYKETVSNSDGTSSDFYYDGISDTATVARLPNDTDCEGLYGITLNNPASQAMLANDLWYKGTIRIPLDTNASEKKELEVLRFTKVNDKITYIEAFDSEYDINEVKVDTSVAINFHPGYRVYVPLESLPSEFNETSIKPQLGEELRKTLLTCWTSVGASTSSIATPAPIFAVEQYIAEPPKLGNFPVYATRPDVDGKSSFTFDIEVEDNATRRPYGFIFYRTNDRSLLDALYIEGTVQGIYDALKANGEVVPLNVRWQGLITTEVDGSTSEYQDYGSGYAFPNPDNTDIDGSLEDGLVKPGNVGGTLLTDAILESFTPLTKEPVLYSELSDDRMYTLKKSDTERFPMAIKYTETGTGKKMVRFTDYTLDGASTNFYFYFAVEVTPDFTISDPSDALGPINLVNSLPPESPKVKKVTTQTEDVLTGTPPAINFELEPYLESEGVKKVRLYRTTEEVYANSVRLMTPVADLDVEANLSDTFSDLAFPPFGEAIFYKLVGLREVKNEKGSTEYVPSVASKTQLASVVDVVNPDAPDISFVFDPTSPVGQMDNVVLSWTKMAHNATYTLYQMNDKGNWVKIYGIKDNSMTLQFPPAITDPADLNVGQPDFASYPETSSLSKDDNGTTIYHRFKVSVENASGLLNLTDEVLII